MNNGKYTNYLTYDQLNNLLYDQLNKNYVQCIWRLEFCQVLAHVVSKILGTAGQWSVGALQDLVGCFEGDGPTMAYWAQNGWVDFVQ